MRGGRAGEEQETGRLDVQAMDDPDLSRNVAREQMHEAGPCVERAEPAGDRQHPARLVDGQHVRGFPDDR
jgi:hypothetical protein